MRYARKRDDNEPEIVVALKACGATVTRLNDAGAPDLLVGFAGKTKLLEVKLPLTAGGAVQPGRHMNSKGGRGDLTPAQAEWWSKWKGELPYVVRSVEEALAAIGANVR